MQKKRVSSLDGHQLSVGAMCHVRVPEGSKVNTYKAKLLACGE